MHADGDKSTPFDLTGTWQSASCGARTYTRRLILHDSGSFEAFDLVSPCPPGAVCVWSGIIRWGGTWKLEPGRVVLSVEAKDGAPLPEHRPGSLQVDTRREAPVLVEDAEGASCPYVRTAVDG